MNIKEQVAALRKPNYPRAGFGGFIKNKIAAGWSVEDHLTDDEKTEFATEIQVGSKLYHERIEENNRRITEEKIRNQVRREEIRKKEEERQYTGSKNDLLRAYEVLKPQIEWAGCRVPNDWLDLERVYDAIHFRKSSVGLKKLLKRADCPEWEKKILLHLIPENERRRQAYKEKKASMLIAEQQKQNTKLAESIVAEQMSIAELLAKERQIDTEVFSAAIKSKLIKMPRIAEAICYSETTARKYVDEIGIRPTWIEEYTLGSGRQRKDVTSYLV